MIINWQKIGIKRLAAIISDHLQKNGIEVVLVGGACVSLYTNNNYISYDIDLITDSPIKKIIPVLEQFGFKNNGSHHNKFIIKDIINTYLCFFLIH